MNSNKISQNEFLINSILFILGLIVNFSAYFSFLPLVAFLIYLLIGRVLLLLFLLNGYYEVKSYYRISLIGWFMSGIAALYLIYFKDNYQLYSDAGDFYNLTINKDLSSISINEIQGFFENALPIYIWHSIYNVFNYLGFPKERYVGIFFNTFVVSFSSVFSVKIARIVFLNDNKRINRLIQLFSFCGIFWLFESIHLRDGLVLLSVTILTYFWVYFLDSKISFKNIIFIIIVNLIFFVIFRFLRAEFTFVPIAFFLSALIAKYFTQTHSRNYYFKSIFISIFLFFSLLVIIKLLGKDLIEIIVNGYKSYNEGSENINSLGNSIIVNQILPIRLFFGFIYLFIFPIPFWSGFQLESAYHLFLSFNVLFFYFISPLFILSIVNFFRYKLNKQATLLFIFFISIGFTFAISLTSLETRHFACFLPSILVFSLIPDISKRFHFIQFKLYSSIFISFIFFIHLLWFVLKFII